MSRERWMLGALSGLGLTACTTATDFMASLQSRAAQTAPACADIDFGGKATVLDGVSQPGGQTVPAGVTPSGATILVQQGGCSTDLALLIADETPVGSGNYVRHPISDLAGMDTSIEEGVTLAADGLTLIGLATRHDAFLQTTRAAVGTVDFSMPSTGPFGALIATGSHAFWAPVLSPDGLAFYYTVRGDPEPALNGIYESVRASTAASFPIATRMAAAIQDVAQYVNAVSTDDLSIFLESRSTWQTFVFTRTRTRDEFTNPLAPNAPPTVPGLRARPVAECGRVIGSCAPHGSGCIREEVCGWAR